jgi:hypothetical protein
MCLVFQGFKISPSLRFFEMTRWGGVLLCSGVEDPQKVEEILRIESNPVNVIGVSSVQDFSDAALCRNDRVGGDEVAGLNCFCWGFATLSQIVEIIANLAFNAKILNQYFPYLCQITIGSFFFPN